MFFEESSRRLSKDAFLVPSFKTSFESSSRPSQWLSSTILNTKSSTPSEWLSSELPGMPRKEMFMVSLSEPSQEQSLTLWHKRWSFLSQTFSLESSSGQVNAHLYCFCGRFRLNYQVDLVKNNFWYYQIKNLLEYRILPQNVPNIISNYSSVESPTKSFHPAAKFT